MNITGSPHRTLTASQVRDADGFAAIGDYAVLGDGRGAALVAADGHVDWWAVPRLDSPPVLSAVLDPERGGHLSLAPTDPEATCERRYLPHTNVLETVWHTDGGSVRVLDSLNSGNAGELPWSELARRIEGIDGSVAMSFLARPGDGMRGWEPWVEDDRRAPLLHAGPVTIGVRCSDAVDVEVNQDRVEATVTVATGERVVIGLLAASNQPLYLSDIESIDARLDVSVEAWRQWAAKVSWDGEGRERIVRSALALKLLLVSQTGAIAAAATTSLPESIGGPKNWDYRFCWVRDAALTIDALADCGQEEEVHAAVAWLLDAIRENGPDVHIMYTPDGEVSDSARKPPLPGYRGSVPVMVGNDATSQLQLGIYGDLFGTVADWVLAGHVLDTRSSRQLADIADRCADVWQHEDAGIWELQDNHHYTSSKMNCWRALDAAYQLAQAGELVGNGHRWRHEATRIRRWVIDNCWSERKQAYTFYAGTEDLDASVMLGSQIGFDTGRRMSSTIDAIGSELGVGPLLYRYSGVHREEHTFLACAFWRVSALTGVGRLEEARSLLTELDDLPTPLGLLSEMVDATDNSLVGNLPQALSHLTLIKASTRLRAAEQAASSGG